MACAVAVYKSAHLANGMMPIYRIPQKQRFGLAWSWLWLGRRSFRADAAACMASLSPAALVSGLSNIPPGGPCLVTFNHFYRPGFNIWWLTMAIAAVLPAEAHVIMSAELTYPGRWFAPAGMALSRFVLKRLARVYAFSAMPPMPPRQKDVAERAKTVRAVLSYMDRHPAALLLLAPEGGDQPGGRLTCPPSGAGRFISLMAARGARILPAAGWEQDGRLHFSFGPLYQLEAAHAATAAEKDRLVSAVVMRAIADLLPEHLRGEFARTTSPADLREEP
jgi:hypothetical protein